MPVASPKCIVLAGGGTGGHISPGLAIAERLRSLSPAVRVIFACSTRAIDAQMLSHERQEYVPIPAEPPSLTPRRLWRFLHSFLPGRQACNALMQQGPDWVVALGGFVSVPVSLAARRNGVPVALLNIDAVPGKANKFLAPRANAVFSAMPVAAMSEYQPRIVGFPIRLANIAQGDPEGARMRLRLAANRPTLLVTGASQGASSLNDLATELATRCAAQIGGWQVLHLAGGSADIAAIEARYRNARITARVIPFLHGMADAWDSASLVLSRAGANSVAEAVYNRVPAVFLPYPWHRDRHQRLNAQPYVDLRGALCCTDHLDTSQNMAEAGEHLLRLMGSSESLAKMRDALGRIERVDAAAEIAKSLLY